MILSAFMEKHSLTQSDFAALAEIDQSTVSRWLSNERAPSLASIFEVETLTSMAVSGDDWLRQFYGPPRSPNRKNNAKMAKVKSGNPL